MGDLSDQIQVYDFVDQMAVLSISDVFITHCGMNSASEGLYFEVPLILFPQTPEQGAVAARVQELGAGVRLGSIDKEEIARAVDRVLKEPVYRENAVRISKSFKSLRRCERSKGIYRVERVTSPPSACFSHPAWAFGSLCESGPPMCESGFRTGRRRFLRR